MNATEECRDISQTHLPAKLQVVDKKVCLKGHKVSGSFLKIQRKRQRKSSKPSCKNNFSALVIFPRLGYVESRAPLNSYLHPSKRLKVKRVKT